MEDDSERRCARFYKWKSGGNVNIGGLGGRARKSICQATLLSEFSVAYCREKKQSMKKQTGIAFKSHENLLNVKVFAETITKLLS